MSLSVFSLACLLLSLSLLAVYLHNLSISHFFVKLYFFPRAHYYVNVNVLKVSDSKMFERAKFLTNIFLSERFAVRTFLK